MGIPFEMDDDGECKEVAIGDIVRFYEQAYPPRTKLGELFKVTRVYWTKNVWGGKSWKVELVSIAPDHPENYPVIRTSLLSVKKTGHAE